jgi:hypothetical protein
LSPKAIAVAGASAIAFAAGGCGGDSDSEAKFRAAFKKSFGETPWYQHVTGIDMKDRGLEITTDLDPDKDVPGSDLSFSYAGSICRPAWGVARETGAIDSSQGVFVTGTDGVALGACG